MADDHYSQVFYASGVSFMLPFGLGKIEEQIKDQSVGDSSLVRIGRKHIVNTEKIMHISTSKQTITIVDNKGNRHVLRVAKAVLRGLIDNASDTFRPI